MSRIKKGYIGFFDTLLAYLVGFLFGYYAAQQSFHQSGNVTTLINHSNTYTKKNSENLQIVKTIEDEAGRKLQIQFRSLTSEVCVNEETIFDLVVLNLISNPTVKVQAVIAAPPGIILYGGYYIGENVRSSSGLVESTATLKPGDALVMRVRAVVLEPGVKTIKAYVYYTFDDIGLNDLKEVIVTYRLDAVPCKEGSSSKAG